MCELQHYPSITCDRFLARRQAKNHPPSTREGQRLGCAGIEDIVECLRCLRAHAARDEVGWCKVGLVEIAVGRAGSRSIAPSLGVAPLGAECDRDELLRGSLRLAESAQGGDPAKSQRRAQCGGGTLCLITTTSLWVVALPVA
jgi:hypothetical protein